ncbi:MAG: type II secretion system protein [Synergistaceae bacterium]|nr:type II secretion system protein [Synergistaceae bacterium]
MIRRRHALTLMELIIGMMILAITATVAIVNINAIKSQTAKREAEKLAQWLTTRMTIADSRNEAFTLSTSASTAVIEWASSKSTSVKQDKLEASTGCTFTLASPLKYSVENNNFTQGGHIKVKAHNNATDTDEYYFVIIATIGGRVRTADKAPSS